MAGRQCARDEGPGSLTGLAEVIEQPHRKRSARPEPTREVALTVVEDRPNVVEAAVR